MRVRLQGGADYIAAHHQHRAAEIKERMGGQMARREAQVALRLRDAVTVRF